MNEHCLEQNIYIYLYPYARKEIHFDNNTKHKIQQTDT